MAISSFNIFAYVSGKVAIEILNLIFNYFIVDIFLNVYHLSYSWFFLVQGLYVVWNSINDPVFAWLQDKTSKRKAIKYGTLLFGLSFVLPWLYPTDKVEFSSETQIGMFYLLTMVFFDGMFTYVCLAHCALFADTSSDNKDRHSVLLYGEIGSILGALPVLASYQVWSRTNLYPFRIFSVFVAIICSLSLWFCSVYSQERVSPYMNRSSSSSSSSNMSPPVTPSSSSYVELDVLPMKPSSTPHSSCSSSACSSSSSSPNLVTFLKQISSNRSFWAFVACNFLQIFHMTVNTNFFSIINETLTSSFLDSNVRSTILACNILFPHFITICLSNQSCLGKLGSYAVIKGMFAFKLIFGFVSYQIAEQSPICLVLFLSLDPSLTAATFALFNMPVADLIDQDLVQYNRQNPMSSMYFGLNALFTKPAQSLAPVVVVRVLEHFGYRHQLEEEAELEKNNANDRSLVLNSMANDPLSLASDPQLLRSALFHLAVLIPIITGAIQLLIWHSCFKLHGSTLKQVQTRLLRETRQSSEE